MKTTRVNAFLLSLLSHLDASFAKAKLKGSPRNGATLTCWNTKYGPIYSIGPGGGSSLPSFGYL